MSKNMMNKDKTFPVRMSQKQFDDFKTIAKKRKEKHSELIRGWINDYIYKNKPSIYNDMYEDMKKDKTLPVRMSQKQYNEFQTAAKQRMERRPEVIRRWIVDYIIKNKSYLE